MSSPGEVRKNFHQQLDEMRSDVLRVGGMVVESIPRATAVLLMGDLQQAEVIINGDDALDARSLELEERCYHILALQQPMAGDQFVLLKIILRNSRQLHHGQINRDSFGKSCRLHDGIDMLAHIRF